MHKQQAFTVMLNMRNNTRNNLNVIFQLLSVIQLYYILQLNFVSLF